MQIRTYLALGLGLLGLAACGGGSSGGGAATPLTIPSQMTIVAAQDGATGSFRITPGGSGRAVSGSGVARMEMGTDFDNDETQLWVHDEAMEPLETINMILCSLEQTGYDDPTVLNNGAYRVLVNEARCESRGGDPTGGAGGAQQAVAVDYQEWIVESTRADANAAQIVKFWIDWEEDAGPEEIGEPMPARLYGRLTIHSSPSVTHPYGKFTLQFKLLQRSADPASQDTLFKGTLSTIDRSDDQAEYTFYMSQGDVASTPQPGEFNMLMRARVLTDAVGTTGRAFSSMRFAFHDGNMPFTEDQTFHLTFNEDYLARKTIQQSEEIEVFDRNDFTIHPWRYGLYDNDTGARVDLESGFGVRTATGEHGWASYHGLWLPEHITVQNGMELTREHFDPNTPDETYTLFAAPGRLEKQTRSASTLGNVRNEPMRYWDQQGMQESLVQWDGSDFVRVAVWSDQQGEWNFLETPVVITQSFSADQWVGFWSEARGEINFIWPSSGTPSDATEISLWGHETINADSPELSSGNLTLHGYFEMMRSAITQAQADYTGGQSPFFPDATNPGEGKTYVFDRTALTLTLDGVDVTLADGVDASNGPSAGGIYGGPMVTAPVSDLGEVHSASTTYRWQTGGEEWNQLRTLVDGDGAFVQFDPPMVFQYTHDEPSNPQFHNKTFRLEYFGNGDLHGVPHFEDGEFDRWYPAFGIPTATVLTNQTGTFKVKVLEAEQTMNKVDNPLQIMNEQGLDLDTTLTAPADTWADPGIGAKPTVTDPPLYIDGVRQGASGTI